MLKIVKNMAQFPFGQMMELYAETNAATAREQFPEFSEYESLYRVEMDFYRYLRYDFFTMGDSFYAIWMEGSLPVSALRFERWKDGWLLEGLETHPQYRGKGYGFRLMEAALEGLTEPVYAHVAKDNAPSLRVHEKCGFVRRGDTALINGNYDKRFVTLMKEKSHG